MLEIVGTLSDQVRALLSGGHVSVDVNVSALGVFDHEERRSIIEKRAEYRDLVELIECGDGRKLGVFRFHGGSDPRSALA
jgi:hypothetical protein